MASPKQLDVVAVLRDRPDLGLIQGWVGTLLSELAPGVWEVEFADGEGRTIATTRKSGDLPAIASSFPLAGVCQRDGYPYAVTRKALNEACGCDDDRGQSTTPSI